MNRQPTFSDALVAVNEAKAWGWKWPPNRKEELVKLDLAAHRANIAGVPSCRSLRCNDDKAYAAKETVSFAPTICLRQSNCSGSPRDAVCTLDHREDASPAKLRPRHMRLLTAVRAGISRYRRGSYMTMSAR